MLVNYIRYYNKKVKSEMEIWIQLRARQEVSQKSYMDYICTLEIFLGTL